MVNAGETDLVLASGSAARRSMLDQAGVPFTVQPADIDETGLKKDLADLPFAGVAMELAMAKALAVSARRPNHWVLGSDQVLVFGDTILSKADNLAVARQRLTALRGQAHHLISAVCLVKDGAVTWTASDQAILVMRDFSDAFLDAYLETEASAALSSVGTYRLEGLGAQLFERVDGDYFTILGMPLWPVLAELRQIGVLRV